MTLDLQTVKQRFGIVGTNPKINEAIRVALQVAPTEVSVLITGESGVGKEFFPKIIHNYSPRKSNKYIAVNCGSIPEGTIDSELFGHRKGSFTGAVNDRKGYFEEADKGTIFLDEIGELPLATQARLLRVLEGGDFLPVGSSVPHKTDVRIVAATNVNLIEAVKQGRFREDLYYRLSTVPIKVPPLRDRNEDILLLFRLFASKSASQNNIPPVELDEEARELFLKYRWPGNVRELKNVTERISLLEEDRLITKAVAEKYLQEEGMRDLHPVLVNPSQSAYSSQQFANEREILYKVLFDLNRSVHDLKSQFDELKQTVLPSQEPLAPTVHHFVSPSSTKIATPESVEEVWTQPIDSNHSEATKEINLVKETNSMTEDEKKKRALELLEGKTLREIEEMVTLHALDRNNGHKGKTAEELGIADRTLYRRLKEYGIE